MKTLLMGLIVGVFSTSLMASDLNVKVKKDTSRNPLTGTVTTTKKYDHKLKGARGAEDKVSVKEQTSVKRDGTVENSYKSDRVHTPKKGE